MQQPSFRIRPAPALVAVLALFIGASVRAQEAATAAAPTPPSASSASSSETGLPAVRVRASRAKPEGDADRGYRSSTAFQVGALGAKPLQDTPFSIQVISRELIENLQASKPDDVIKINPVLQLNNPQSRFFSGVTMRGFSVGSNKRIDGQPNANMVSVDMEDKERVEVLTGLSGFLYGPGNVGGTLNYVLKRPMAERISRVTVGLTEGSNAYVHGDFNLPVDELGHLATRLNVVAQDGGTATDHQSIARQLVSGAVDWTLSQRLKVQFDASYSHYRMDGTNPYWSVYNSAVSYPAAPDMGQFWGQPFTYTETHQAHAAARLQWALNDALAVRAGIARRKSDAVLTAANNILTSSSGTYAVQTSNWEYPDITNQAIYALADLRFNTGVARHKVTAGFFGDIDQRTNYRSSPGGWAANTTGGFNLSSPIYFTTEPLPATGAKYVANRTHNRNVVLGDDIEFGDRWGALLGLTQATIYDKTFGETGATTTVYDETRVTPSVSLLFKPVADVTVYGSYIEGLEKGGTAAATYDGVAVSNAGQVKPPLESRQLELGVKATVGNSLLTAALFQIDKGLQYYERSGSGPYTFVQDGRQVHTGLELTSTGRVLPGWTLVGGLTLMDAKVTRNGQTPALEGKTPANVAETFAKVYAEYDVPALAGLTLTGGIYYTGKQAVNALNTDEIPDFTTADIGVRYKTRVNDLPLTLRLNIRNVTDKNYWLTANSLGAPRALALSGQIDF